MTRLEGTFGSWDDCLVSVAKLYSEYMVLRAVALCPFGWLFLPSFLCQMTLSWRLLVQLRSCISALKLTRRLPHTTDFYFS